MWLYSLRSFSQPSILSFTALTSLFKKKDIQPSLLNKQTQRPEIDIQPSLLNNQTQRSEEFQPPSLRPPSPRSEYEEIRKSFSSHTVSSESACDPLIIEEVDISNSNQQNTIIKTIDQWSRYCQTITALSDQPTSICEEKNRETFEIIDILARDFNRIIAWPYFLDQYFVCKKNGHIEGICVLRAYEDHFKIFDLSTHPKNITDSCNQNPVKGVGRALMRHIFGRCLKQNKPLQLDASPVAEGFYKKLNLRGHGYINLGHHRCLQMSISPAGMRQELERSVS